MSLYRSPPKISNAMLIQHGSMWIVIEYVVILKESKITNFLCGKEGRGMEIGVQYTSVQVIVSCTLLLKTVIVLNN